MDRQSIRVLIVELLLGILLVPTLCFTAAYLEFRILGTMRLKQVLQIDRLSDLLDPVNRRTFGG